MSNWPWDYLDAVVFSRASGRPGVLRKLARIGRYPYAVLRDVAGGQINMRATALVFTTVLSLVPLLAFSFIIIRELGGHHAGRDLQPIVLEFFRPVGAGADDMTRQVLEFAGRMRRGVVGIVGIALLAWSLIGTIQKVEDSFNYVWRVPQPRSLARRVGEFLSLLVIGPVLLGGFIALSHTALLAGPLQLANSLPLINRLMNVGVHVAPYAMVTVLFTFLYMFIPNTRVRLGPALIGAVVAGIAWAAVGILFTRFVEYSARLTLVYAGFAAVIAVVMWTYFGWLILLTGAQLSFYIQNPSYLRFGLRQLQLSAAELEQLALTVTFLVGHNAGTGRPRYTLDAVATHLGVTGLALAPLIGALENARVLKLSGEELLLARDPARLAIADIIEAARHLHSGKPVSRALGVPGVSQLVAQVDAARRASCAGQTLQELLQTSPLLVSEAASGESGEWPAPSPPPDATRRLSSDRR
ncbi:MAG TPA: YihY/virulence factor BrkB family protein [Steroidobacteraceae bacterium]|jgi:membrane protein|nr:YihY/virulence factor BrkB family protein [Steroidobacteraceae bacterium]